MIGLFLAQVLARTLLHDLRHVLGLGDRGLDALALLTGNALVFTVSMHLARLDYRTLFHDSRSSVAATTLLLVPLVAALVPGLVVAMGGLMAVLERLAPLSRWEQELFERFASGSLPILVSICVLAPVLEEMLFRGLVLRSFLGRYPRWQAIGFSAILFGAAHLNLYQFAVGVVSGLLLGWLYERTRSLLPCIALHGFYNGAVTWYALETGKGPRGSWDGAVLALVLSLGSLALLHRLLAPRPARAA